MAEKKTVVYHRETVPDDFSAETMLEKMKRDREGLIKHWGEDEYEKRRKSLEEHILNRGQRKVAKDREA